jgi:hypothetical protein
MSAAASFPAAHCWFCAGRLPPTFTTILRNGVHVRVHYGCRVEAEAVAGHAVIVEEQEDSFVLPIG